MIESFEAVMNKPHKGWPTLDDFQHKRVFIHNEIIKRVEDLIQKHRRCLIRGAEGRGKTVLARVVGFCKYKEKWKIRFIDVRQTRWEHVDGICETINGIGDRRTLFIVENTHSSLDEITPKLIESANEHPEASFIFTSRKIFPGREQLLIPNPFEEWEEKRWRVDLNPGSEVTHGVIETFTSARKMDYSLTEEDESWIERELGKRSVNLRRLKWHLETWNEIGGPFSSVTKEKVLEKLLKSFLIGEVGIALEQMLLKVSGIFQFDVNFFGRNYDRAILTELVKSGIVAFLEGHYYKLQHSSDAAYIIEAVAILREKRDPAAITTDILKEYMRKKPENYHELMKGLFISKKKRILSGIFEDQETCEAIFDMVKQDRIGAVSSVLEYLTWACGKERGLDFWSKYRKLGVDSPEEQKKKLKAKLDEVSLTEVKLLLSSLSRVDINEKDWLANEVLDEDILAQKTEDASFSTIADLLGLLPNGKLDPNVIGEKAKSSTAQSIMWFLKYCLRDPANINFVNSFLLAINKGELIEKLRNSPLSVVREWLKITKRINPDLSRELKSSLSPHQMQIWLSSSLSTVANQLYRYRSSVGERKEFATSVVNKLASIELSEPIRKLYSDPRIRPLKALGKLLDSVHQIAFETDKDSIDRITQGIVNNVDLKMRKTYTIEELSCLVSGARKCNESAWTQLCSRILSELDLTDYISIPFDKGLASLVWDIYQYDKEKGQELANKIFSLDLNTLLDRSKTEAVSRLLWNLLQINDSKTKSWVQTIEEDKWLLMKALSCSTHDLFWLLWSLYHADEERGKSITRLVADNVLPSLTTVRAEHLPLLGFFVFLNIQFDPNMPMPPLFEVAEEVSEDLSLVEVAFCICLLRKKNDKLLREFSKELGRRLFAKNISFPIQQMMKEYPFENTRQVLMEIFEDFDVPKEPDSTLAEMICLTKTYLEKKTKTKVAFSQLRDFFLSNPISDPIFHSPYESNRWIHIAIEHGIYQTKEVPHYKHPSSTVMLLSLNENDRFVSLSLEANAM